MFFVLTIHQKMDRSLKFVNPARNLVVCTLFDVDLISGEVAEGFPSDERKEAGTRSPAGC